MCIFARRRIGMLWAKTIKKEITVVPITMQTSIMESLNAAYKFNET